MFSTVSPGGTVAATPVADLPHATGRGSFIDRRFGGGVRDESDIQCPHRGLAGYRGLHLPSQCHMTTKRDVSRQVVGSNRWHGNWIIRLQEISPGFVQATFSDTILKPGCPDFVRVTGDYERPR